MAIACRACRVLSEPSHRGQRRKLYWCEECGALKMSGGASTGERGMDFLLELAENVARAGVTVPDPGTERGRATVRALGSRELPAVTNLERVYRYTDACGRRFVAPVGCPDLLDLDSGRIHHVTWPRGLKLDRSGWRMEPGSFREALALGLTPAERSVYQALRREGHVLRHGWPDFLVLGDRPRAVEVKTKKLAFEPTQLAMHAALRDLGLEVEVVVA